MNIKNLLKIDIDEKEKENFRKNIVTENIKRGKLLSKVIILFEALFILIDLSAYGFKVDKSFKFYSYLLIYLLMLIVNLIFWFYLSKLKNISGKSKLEIKKIDTVTTAYITFIMSWGSITSLMDQKLYGQVTAFIVNMIISSVIYYLDDFQIIIPFSISSLILCVGLPFFQPSKNILIGHYVNLFVAIVISWFASRTIYASYCNSFNNSKLIQLDKLKDEFLANTSHELRTPLNGIINITQSLLKGSAGELNSVQTQNLQSVVDSSRRLYNLINDILDISIIKHDEIKLHPKVINLRAAAETVIFIFEHMKSKKEVRFQNLISPKIPPIFFDEERLNQVFFNLIGNALKFTEKGSITVNAKVSGNKVITWVHDTGIGIEGAMLNKVFNAFEQADGSVSRKYPGTGLGLYISKHLIELGGGEMWVESEIGHGSRFYFSLPISEESSPSNFINSSVSTNINSEMLSLQHDSIYEESKHEKYNILSIDDDITNLRALSNTLELEGYTVKSITNGYSAIQLLQGGINFDIVILDVMMPGISGYSVLEKIREKYLPIELPVLLLTARNRPDDISIGFKLQANDYLVKPFQSEELIARVKNLIELKQSANDLVKAELSFLQAQIKPHFIYNALSIISSLCISKPERAKNLILDLSEYLRGNLETNPQEGLTTLRNELEIVRAYLNIEQERFDERLYVSFDIDEGLNCELPMLSIQPIVENAVRHGIMQKLEGGKISIYVGREEGHIKIKISDNGVGISEEALKEIFNKTYKKGGIGLKNINRRLIALYGRGLTITGDASTGTVVEFWVPYK